MTLLARSNHPGSQSSFINAANQSVLVGGIPFAYRDQGPRTQVPLVMFNHWGAVLDNFDPRIIDGLAKTGVSSPPITAVSVARVAPRH